MSQQTMQLTHCFPYKFLWLAFGSPKFFATFAANFTFCIFVDFATYLRCRDTSDVRQQEEQNQ